MIAPRDFLPHVDFGRGRVMPFDRDWLRDSIYVAARSYGHTRWWAEQVASSIEMFLTNESVVSVITVGEIGDIVRHVLDRVGAEEVSRTFHTLPPRLRIELEPLAEQAGDGFELIFFERLKSEVMDAAARSFSFIRLEGLRSSVKRLCRTRRWRRRCAELEEEIVDHVRTVLSASAVRGPLHLVVS